MIGSDERHEAQDNREHAPEQRIGHADQPQSDADGNAVGRIHDKLHQQVPTHALGGVAQRLGGAVQVSATDQPDEAVAQVLPLQQHEHHKHDDDACGRQRFDQRTDDRLQHLQRCRVGLPDLNGDRLRLGRLRLERRRSFLFRRRFGRLFDVLPEIAQHFRCALDQAAAGCARLQGADLLPDVVLIARKACPELRDLTSDDKAEDENAQEGEDHHGDHRGGSRNPPTAQRGDHRGECEAEKPCKRERHEDVAPEVEGSDGQPPRPLETVSRSPAAREGWLAATLFEAEAGPYPFPSLPSWLA